MIAKIPFGKTGHLSTRTVFGAAAFMSMRQERADQVLETLLEFGVNHIDVAASYGDAELRVGPWMKEHRDRFFLASKTGERTAAGARDGIQKSLQRLQVDQIDLIQFHNLTDEAGWETAMGPDGALEAALEARDKGRVRFIGVTGHGTAAPKMHLRSLERFEFDSVLFPYNYLLMQDPEYAADVERLLKVCGDRGVAVQTIKSIARRRFREGDTSKRFSWYEPVKEPETLKQVVHYVLSRPNLFLNTSSDTTLLRSILKAADEFEDGTAAADLEEPLKAAAASQEMEPLFVRGQADSI
ncbi:MAG: aldo/keto reductase [Proteobacteria bacterium]|nr:aldo/keto reductase [Pseudomonadota bacterium]